MEPKVETKPPN